MPPEGDPPSARLAPVPAADKAALRAYLDPYLIEHADQVDPQREYGDPTDYEYFDLYWVEPQRHAYWVIDDGQRAGFVMVNEWSPSGRGTQRSIAEFYIRPELRRRGLGQAAALAALDTHAGLWELQVYRANLDGMAFWPQVIAAASAKDWEAMECDDRVIHRFRVG
jgi:predicted acetyltransferase